MSKKCHEENCIHMGISANNPYEKLFVTATISLKKSGSGSVVYTNLQTTNKFVSVSCEDSTCLWHLWCPFDL